MRKLGKWLGRILLVLIAAVIVIGVTKRAEIERLWRVSTMFSEDYIVSNFSNMDVYSPTAPLPRGDGPVSPLPQGAPAQMPPETAQWIKDRSVTSMLVLKDGEIRYEDYFLGTTPDDRRMSWSVAKSYLSALFGILLDEGAIASIDDPVTQYAPALKGTAYDGASIRNVLNMASGVVFDEDYFDQSSDINRMGRVLALGGTLDGFTASFTETFAEPGTQWQYVSIDTHALGMVIRGATGRGVPALMAEKIIAPLGLESDGYYVTDFDGAAFVLAGLNFTTRDYARFGQMIAQNGMLGGQQIVPADWIAASTVASAPTEPGKIGYGYQWWVPTGAPAGEFLGRGVYGQFLYIDQARGVVIVATGADRKFREPGVQAKNIEFFRKIAKTL